MTSLITVLLFCIAGLLAIAAGAIVWHCWERSPAQVQTPALTTYCFVRAWKPMDDAQLAAALGGWRESDPKWKAMWDVLAREMEAEIQGLTTAKGAEELSRVAGRLEMVMLIRQNLLRWRQLPGGGEEL